MSVVKEQAKELGVDAAGGAKDGGQERDTMINSVGMLILIDFLLGSLTQRLVDVRLLSGCPRRRSGSSHVVVSHFKFVPL
jgi:hypothetical protein